MHNKWIKFMVKTKTRCRRSSCSSGTTTSRPASPRSCDAKLMGEQNQLLRLNCKGNFKDFVKAMNTQRRR